MKPLGVPVGPQINRDRCAIQGLSHGHGQHPPTPVHLQCTQQSAVDLEMQVSWAAHHMPVLYTAAAEAEASTVTTSVN